MSVKRIWFDGQSWYRHGLTAVQTKTPATHMFHPLRAWCLIDKSRGEWYWWDFIAGKWSAVLTVTCLCEERKQADIMAKETGGVVEKYAVIPESKWKKS